MNGADRIVAVLDHLQVPQAHVAGSSSLDWAGLLVAHAGRITGLTVPLPYMGAALPNDLSGISTPVHVLSGLEGAVAARAKKLAAMFPNGEFHGIAGYSSVIWSDICADHPGVMADLLTRNAADMPPASVPAGQGTHAGINYDVSGHGPALVLAPLALAPSQWDPVIETLATRFTVIRLSAPHLGLLVTLEDRARSGYGAMARDVFLRANPAPGAEVLEVGCGGGSVTRLLADVLPDHAQMTASDISPYLLREAQALGTRHARSGALTYIPADALALPFPDARFDIVCSFTVLEEADADVMLAEQLRVLRPGGHLVAVVRAVDHGWWLNLEGSDAEKEYWAGLGHFYFLKKRFSQSK